VGSQIADGGLPWRYAPDGTVALQSPPKEVRAFGGVDHVLESAITTDFALVAAAVGDRHGNLVFDKSAQNFNPLCAMAGRVTMVEVQQLVEPGEIEPAHVHLPGVFVQHVVHAPDVEKHIERITVTEGAS
jgi:3-oxoacid CoA-transferase subunit A